MLLALSLPVAALAANDDEDFYRGKTISLIIPIGPGGAYDTYARLVARYLGKELPGNPVIVPRNMPGAGGTIASNYVYNLAPQDGTTLTIITSSFAMEQLFENPQIRSFNSRAKVGGKDIGIVFNAYDFATGEAVLFGNETARKNKELWPPSKKIPQKPLSARARRRRTATNTGSKEPELELRQITAEAVESALWLSLYGFEGLPQPHLIDGAYMRSCIVSELHQFDRIFVARPLARGWPGKPPRNWFEVQDWQTEMWFSAGYKAEVDTLTQINRLVDNGTLGHPFKHVDLIEIAPESPVGFFNYFVERKKVFKRAHDEAIKAFSAIGATSTAGNSAISHARIPSTGQSRRKPSR
jgi:hypothetical protein